MLKLTKLFKNFKRKLAVGAVGTVLLASPGVALAHGSHGDRDNGSSRHNWSDNNWWNKHNNHDEWDQTCEERQEAANQAVENYKAKAQERYNGLSAYLFNQQTFVSDNNLTVEKYDRYNEKAMKAQTRAQEVLDETQAPTINCNRGERHDKRQIREAKEDLKEAIERFENSVQRVSFVIGESVAISS